MRTSNRVEAAGVDLGRMARAAVLILVGDLDARNVRSHPVWPLCRALAPLGCRALYVCGGSSYFAALADGVMAPNIVHFPGNWSAEVVARFAPPADVLVDLTNRFDLSRFRAGAGTHGTHRIFTAWGRTWAAMFNPASSGECGIELAPSIRTEEFPLAPVSRIVAGLVLQEIVIKVGRFSRACPPQPWVGYDCAAAARIDERTVATWPALPVARAVIDVVGAGGLGVHLLESLISCLDSTCELRIFDPDVVAEENLAMQIAYTESDIGAPKALVMAKHLGLQSPRTRIRPYVERYEQRPRERTPPTLRIACVDSFASRKALNDMALADGIPLAEAGSAPWAAQQRTYLPGRTACLEHRIRNLSRKAATEKESQGCAQNPALTLPGTNMVIGGILAAESLRALQPESFGCPSDGTITYDVRAPARFGIVDSRQACEHSRVEDH